MRICDICKANGIRYNKYATTDEKGNGATLELCGSCYHTLYNKQQHHDYLAYKETVEEITGESPKRKSWLSILKK